MAIPYSKQTWTDGVSAVSAARMGVIEQGVFDAHAMPSARVYHNATQSIADATWVALAFNSERFDNDTIHDTVTNNSRLTCKTAGTYLIVAQCEFAANGTGRRYVDVYLNGATTLARSEVIPSASYLPGQNVATLYTLAVNDYLQLRVHQSSGGALDVPVIGNYTPEFSMVRVA